MIDEVAHFLFIVKEFNRMQYIRLAGISYYNDCRQIRKTTGAVETISSCCYSLLEIFDTSDKSIIVSSINKMYGLCFRAVRQTAGVKATRLLQMRTFRASVSVTRRLLLFCVMQYLTCYHTYPGRSLYVVRAKVGSSLVQ